MGGGGCGGVGRVGAGWWRAARRGVVTSPSECHSPVSRWRHERARSFAGRGGRGVVVPGVQRCRPSHSAAGTAAVVLLQRLPPTRLPLAARPPCPHRRHSGRTRAERFHRLRSIPRCAHASRLRHPVPRPPQSPAHGVRRARSAVAGPHRAPHALRLLVHQLQVVPSLRRPRHPTDRPAGNRQSAAATPAAVGALDTRRLRDLRPTPHDAHLGNEAHVAVR